eukprot:TRINITY_DN8126_c0_g2_i1.p1 TRINITY_DN8126_c0_g2~~TRINITY_DN8126_c0_g2_i1.p1  ORF type:complete len:204 (+),score=40.76 TRINITY_DN8126_c0_g2_i1:54-665(+)
MPPERESEFCRNIRNHESFRLNIVTGRWDFEDSCTYNRPQLCKLFRRFRQAAKERESLVALHQVAKEHIAFGDEMLNNLRKRLAYLRQLPEDEEDEEEIRIEFNNKMKSQKRQLLEPDHPTPTNAKKEEEAPSPPVMSTPKAKQPLHSPSHAEPLSIRRPDAVTDPAPDPAPESDQEPMSDLEALIGDIDPTLGLDLPDDEFF